MEQLKKKIEAILFSVARYISLEEIASLCKKDTKLVKEAILELQVDYENDGKTSLVVLNDGNMWKMNTREEYGNLVRSVVSETELTKTQLETLAVIAFKYPIKQSELIKIRTNKAYDHLSELENAGFITRQKYGRSRLIKLTDKFFEYFDLPRDKLKERFKGFKDLANSIENKEEEIDQLREEQQKIAEEARKQEEEERKLRDGEVEIDLIDEKGHKEKLDVYDEKGKDGSIEDIEKLGNLEVVDEEKKEDENKEEWKTVKGSKERKEKQKEDIVPDLYEKENIKENIPDDEAEKEQNLKSVDEVLGKENKKEENLEEDTEEELEEETKHKEGKKDENTDS